MEHIISKTTEIELHLDNINWEEGFYLSKSCKLLLQTLKEQMKYLFYNEK
jgi:exonuclease VII small subunit